MGTKFKAGLCSLLVVGLLALSIEPVMTRVEAQDTSSGHNEVLSTVSASISTTAAVVAAVSGKRIVVKAMTIRSSGAGVVVFQDGSGGTTLANVYLEADKPFTIDDRVLGEGIKTTSGNGLYAVLSGATLTGIFRVQRQ